MMEDKPDQDRDDGGSGMAEVLDYTQEVEQFLVEHGYPPDLAKDVCDYWRANPSRLMLTQLPDYWYYSLLCDLVGSPDHMSYHFHDMCRKNEYNATQGDDQAGCMFCLRLFRVAEAKELVEDALVRCGAKTMCCPHCHNPTVVCKQRWCDDFERLLAEAHRFWFVQPRYRLVHFDNVGATRTSS